MHLLPPRKTAKAKDFDGIPPNPNAPGLPGMVSRIWPHCYQPLICGQQVAGTPNRSSKCKNREPPPEEVPHNQHANTDPFLANNTFLPNPHLSLPALRGNMESDSDTEDVTMPSKRQRHSSADEVSLLTTALNSVLRLS